MIKNKKYFRPIIYGLISIVCALLLNDEIYYDYIKNPSNSPASSTGGRLFYTLLYFIDKHLGIFGVYACFILIAGFFFLKAYRMYRNENQGKRI